MLTESQTISQTASKDTGENVANIALIKKVIGNRTITQFCEDSGLSSGYVSRLLNNKLTTKPTVRTLAKISCAGEDRDEKDTLSVMLRAYGHKLNDDEIIREIRIAKKTSKVLEEERSTASLGRYGSINLDASAMGLLFSNLMMMGVSLGNVEHLGVKDGIEFCVESDDVNRVIAIPGVNGNDNLLEIRTERDILSKLLKFVSRQKEASLYVVLTDQEDVYNYISGVIGNSVDSAAYVLLLSKGHSCFLKQCYFAAKGEKAPFDFVTKKIN